MTRSTETAGVRWWLAAGANPALLDSALPRILGALERGALHNEKQGRRKELYRVRLAGGSGAPDALLKVNHYGSVGVWRRYGRRSKARHELRLAESIARRGIATPVPLAAGERRQAGRLVCCYLVVPLVAGARDLRELWFRTSLLPTQRRAVVEAFGRFSRQVCEAGVFQDDFAPNNFLVVPGLTPQFLMIDFERARLRPATARGIRFMLAKIDREMAGASAADRMRFLRAFSGDRASKARAWWIRVRSFAPRLALRDLRRLGRTATRDGRRFRVLSENGWSGWAHRGASDDLLARAREDLEVPGSTFALERWDDRWRVTYASVSRLEAARLWSLARWLHARRLGLEPRVLWWRDGLAGMVLETALPSIAVAEAKTHPDAPAALRVLLDRALALARIRGTLDGDAVVFVADPCGLRARFAAPHVLHLSGRGQENGAALSAALSSRLLG